MLKPCTAWAQAPDGLVATVPNPYADGETSGALPVPPSRAPQTRRPERKPPEGVAGPSESEVKSHCVTAIVWVNPKSRVYHAASSRYYGKTKRGSYMCETEATNAGYREAGKLKPAKSGS